jgi:predicted N-acetyltransferase YhbS
MMTGLRTHGEARCRLRVPEGLPEHMRDGVRELTALEVPAELRGRGMGAALVGKVAREADRKRKVLFLQASEPALVPFYERFGFGVIQAEPILMSLAPANG